MRITGVRSILYAYRATRAIGDVHLPEGTRELADLAVFVDTDEAITGVAVGFAGAQSMLHALEPLLIGEDPRSVRGLWERMLRAAFKQGVAGMKTAIAAIDCALWDLRAKANGVPLWKELGAREGRCGVYASGLDMPLSDSELVSYYRSMADKGFNAGKLKVGRDQEADLRRLGVMKAALSESGRSPVLMIDSNEYWAPKQAIRRIHEMEQSFDLAWAEEPATRWDYRGLALVGASIRAAVATGENLAISHDYVRLIDHGAVGVVQMAASTCGITGAMQIADLAYAHDLPVSMMNNPGRFMAHAAAAMPHHTMMEVLDCGRDQVFTSDHRFDEGTIILGDQPGAGITFDADALARHAVRNGPVRGLSSVYRRARGSGRDERRDVAVRPG